jgi:hypothetical protein
LQCSFLPPALTETDFREALDPVRALPDMPSPKAQMILVSLSQQIKPDSLHHAFAYASTYRRKKNYLVCRYMLS